MSAMLTLDSLIMRRPDLHGGRPSISSTGITVRTIVGHYKLGLTPEEIAAETNTSLAEVYAALAYYHMNHAEIEADMFNNSEAAVKQEFGLA